MNPYSNKVFSQGQFKHSNGSQEILSDIPSDPQNVFSVQRSKPVIFLSMVLLVLCLCFLPWPTRIDLTLPGGKISTEGVLIQEGTIQLEGWQYNYLFRQDQMKVAVEVMDLTLSQTVWQKQSFHAGILGHFRHMVQFIYVNELESYQLSHISIALDDSWFLVKIGPDIYFGSGNPEMGAKAILEECRLVIY